MCSIRPGLFPQLGDVHAPILIGRGGRRQARHVPGPASTCQAGISSVWAALAGVWHGRGRGAGRGAASPPRWAWDPVRAGPAWGRGQGRRRRGYRRGLEGRRRTVRHTGLLRHRQARHGPAHGCQRRGDAGNKLRRRDPQHRRQRDQPYGHEDDSARPAQGPGQFRRSPGQAPRLRGPGRPASRGARRGIAGSAPAPQTERRPAWQARPGHSEAVPQAQGDQPAPTAATLRGTAYVPQPRATCSLSKSPAARCALWPVSCPRKMSAATTRSAMPRPRPAAPGSQEPWQPLQVAGPSAPQPVAGSARRRWRRLARGRVVGARPRPVVAGAFLPRAAAEPPCRSRWHGDCSSRFAPAVGVALRRAVMGAPAREGRCRAFRRGGQLALSHPYHQWHDHRMAARLLPREPPQVRVDPIGHLGARPAHLDGPGHLLAHLFRVGRCSRPRPQTRA